MSNEREVIIHHLRVVYSSGVVIERLEDKEENINEIKRAIELNPVLSLDERSILACAYKDAITDRRNAIIECQHQLERINREEQPLVAARLEEFYVKVKRELKGICMDIIGLINSTLLPAANETDQRLFFLKMTADYYRYLCEMRDDAQFDIYCRSAQEAYENAMAMAKSLSPACPQYLGVVLNYTVFLHDTLQQRNNAIELAESTFGEVVDILNPDLHPMDYGEATRYLKILKENLENWKAQRDRAQL